MTKKLYFGKMVIGEGDFLDILVSGRRYIVHVTEVTDYNQIVGETPNGDPVMVRASKVTAIRKVSKSDFEQLKGETDATE